MTERFDLEEAAAFEAWLAGQPRALVLYAGVGCPYSAAFERAFLEEAPAGWPIAVRAVENGGRGPVGEAARVDVTPTVEARVGARVERLEARLLLGITRGRYRSWLRTLPSA